MPNTDILIVGGGPAGLTAAIYARRAGHSVVLFERMTAGGQLATTPEVENYPSIKSISGFELAMNMEKHAKSLGAIIRYEDIVDYQLFGGTPAILTNSERIEGRALILAMGASRRKLGCNGEDKFLGRGVSYCATCDGAFFKGQTCAVVGGGNTALEDALYLAGLGCQVYLIHRRDAVRGGRILEERVYREPKITLLLQQTVESIDGTQRVEQIKLKHVNTSEETILPVNGVFVAVGVLPQSAQLANHLKLTESGHVDSDENCKTSLEGVFVAGDLRKKPLYQIVTACSDGAIAATAASQFIQG